MINQSTNQPISASSRPEFEPRGGGSAVDRNQSANLLMISGDKDLIKGNKGPF